MIAFSKAKINLGLYVISKRPDGFHDLQTLFYPISLCDILEIVPSEKLSLISSGRDVHGDQTNNLVLLAYRLLKKIFPAIGNLAIHLHKAIPPGAGLGGGSGDAAKMLQLLNVFFELNITEKKLEKYALELGSDCPFFLQANPCYATGRGEILEPVELDLSGYSFLLIHPEIHINTTLAFSAIRPGAPVNDLRKSIMQPIAEWKETVYNDFEVSVFKAHPVLGQIKDKLYAAGALYASMTGSGSTLYGIFHKDRLPELKLEHASQTRIP